jgi:hypothetical protein
MGTWKPMSLLPETSCRVDSGTIKIVINNIIFDLNFLSRFPETRKPAETNGNQETKMTKY